MSEQRINWQKVMGNNKYGLRSVFHDVGEEDNKYNKNFIISLCLFIVSAMLLYPLRESISF